MTPYEQGRFNGRREGLKEAQEALRRAKAKSRNALFRSGIEIAIGKIESLLWDKQPMKTSDLITILKGKPQDQEVEFMVVDANTSGIVAMEMTANVVDMEKLLKAFKPKKPKKGG